MENKFFEDINCTLIVVKCNACNIYSHANGIYEHLKTKTHKENIENFKGGNLLTKIKKKKDGKIEESNMIPRKYVVNEKNEASYRCDACNKTFCYVSIYSHLKSIIHKKKLEEYKKENGDKCATFKIIIKPDGTKIEQEWNSKACERIMKENKKQNVNYVTRKL